MNFLSKYPLSLDATSPDWMSQIMSMLPLSASSTVTAGALHAHSTTEWMTEEGEKSLCEAFLPFQEISALPQLEQPRSIKVKSPTLLGWPASMALVN